jgi:hypothetical protein
VRASPSWRKRLRYASPVFAYALMPNIVAIYIQVLINHMPRDLIMSIAVDGDFPRLCARSPRFVLLARCCEQHRAGHEAIRRGGGGGGC